VRKSSYDWDRIAEDYRSGMTLLQIRDKYGVSVSRVSEILRAKGVKTRGPLDRDRKLVRVGKQRLVSLPYELLEKLGVKKDEELWYRWEPEGENRMVLRISRRPDRYRMYRSGATRIVRFITEERGEMRGRWLLEGNRLVLELTSVSESSS
jgi:transcriptional regulator with XRE-family HTH domain